MSFPVHTSSRRAAVARASLSGRRAQRGFTLLELGITLLVIGLLLGAVAVGRDLQRAAANQRLSTDFVQGWQLAYEAFLSAQITRHPPGDDPADPSGKVNGGSTELCGTPMINAFLASGIRLPEGRAEGQPDRQVYLDSNGNPQEVQVCFRNVTWAEAGDSVGTYVQLPRNVMVLKGVTYSLAAMLDQQIDGRADARFGRLRDVLYAGDHLVTTGQIWPLDDRMAYGTTTPDFRDEQQVAITTAYFLMTQ